MKIHIMLNLDFKALKPSSGERGKVPRVIKSVLFDRNPLSISMSASMVEATTLITTQGVQQSLVCREASKAREK